jgi:membrane protease YdiL (CAAX protease family)
MSRSKKKIGVFLLLTLAFSSIFYFLIIRSGSVGALGLGLMWCPGVAGLITQFAFERSLRGMGWKPGKAKYLLAGYGLPVLYGLGVYALVWLSGLGKLGLSEFGAQAAAGLGMAAASPAVFALVYILVMAVVGGIGSCLSALGEEIGWRGLLVPELAREHTFSATAWISGGIWAAWHLPIVLFGGYLTPGLPLWFGVPCFTFMVLGISFVFAWLRLKSGSLWSAVLLHASHNLFIQSVFTPLTLDSGATKYWIDEFGIGLALAAGVVAYLFWRRRDQLLKAGAAA